jgi:hypothetical protein
LFIEGSHTTKNMASCQFINLPFDHHPYFPFQSSGKVVYFTALFPYVVLTIFFVRGLTLKGAGAGLAHMFYPKMESLLQPTVWLNAAVQVRTIGI